MYFYEMPRLMQLAVLSDMAYDEVARVDFYDHDLISVYVITDKSGTEWAYKSDGTRWADIDFWDAIGWLPPM